MQESIDVSTTVIHIGENFKLLISSKVRVISSNVQIAGFVICKR